MVETKLKARREKTKIDEESVEQLNETVQPLQYAVGRRKRSVARVRMYTGSGRIIINGKPVDKFISSKSRMIEFMKPLVQSGVIDTHYFTVKVVGGGITGQLEAARHGMARCIAKISEDMRKIMRAGGFLTRDPREKERKKVYHVGARKSPQYSKR